MYMLSNVALESAGEETRILVDIDANGGFKIDLKKGEPYVFCFIDDHFSGEKMVKYSFKTDNLDSLFTTIASKKNTKADMSCNDTTKTCSLGYANYVKFLTDIGMDEIKAKKYGNRDDNMRRYCMPDIDDNGVVDLKQDDMPTLTLLFTFEFSYGINASKLPYCKGTPNYVTDYVRTMQELPTNDIDICLGGGGIEFQARPIDDSKVLHSAFTQTPTKFTLSQHSKVDYFNL